MQRDHWDSVYRTVAADAVSWHQPEPRLSLEFIRRVAPDPGAAIIDVGGGASTLTDYLVAAGYHRLTVLDLAPTALSTTRNRLGAAGARVTWIEADVLAATLPPSGYDVWHDRAVFHFLTEPADRHRYLAQVRYAVRPAGHVVIASFAPDGPTRCSGLPVVRYSPEELAAEFQPGFQLIDTAREDHLTPAGRRQPFVYCLFRRMNEERSG